MGLGFAGRRSGTVGKRERSWPACLPVSPLRPFDSLVSGVLRALTSVLLSPADASGRDSDLASPFGTERRGTCGTPSHSAEASQRGSMLVPIAHRYPAAENLDALRRSRARRALTPDFKGGFGFFSNDFRLTDEASSAHAEDSGRRS